LQRRGGRLLPGADPQRRRAHDELLQVHDVRAPVARELSRVFWLGEKKKKMVLVVMFGYPEGFGLFFVNDSAFREGGNIGFVWSMYGAFSAELFVWIDNKGVVSCPRESSEPVRSLVIVDSPARYIVTIARQEQRRRARPR
jgi:hypothetical protein